MADFLGRTIEGEVSRDRGPHIVQEDPALLLEALDRLLAVPGVEAVRWTQDTPSFNDGDPCVFGVNEITVRITGDNVDEDEDEYEDNFRSEYSLYDYDRGDWDNKRFKTINGFDMAPVYEGINSFERVIRSGAHDNVLVEKFGDPSEVTATAEGFEVGYYENY